MLMSDDLPTLERPIKAYSGRVLSGQAFRLGLLSTNVAPGYVHKGLFLEVNQRPVKVNSPLIISNSLSEGVSQPPL